MNLYSNKQRWKIALMILALAIVGITLWYSNHIAERIRNEERQKVELWSEAIKRRAELVNFTQNLFDQLKSEENKKAKLLGSAYNIISDPTYESDLTFITEYIWSNTTIPVLIYDEYGKLWNSVNLPAGKETDEHYIDSLRKAVSLKNAPITLAEVGLTIYYDDSRLFKQLQETMDDLINSFISETVINSASAPVIVVDSTQTKVMRKGNVDESQFATPELLSAKLAAMRSANDPIEVVLPGQGKQYIFYEDSELLKRLKMFPVFQLIMIGVFLMVSYLSFSTFRKAEQNQVWVGMSKETAHQLGTPLSSLMAWIQLLESQGVEKSIIEELNKDVDRLNTITDRFSKIGSVPELKEENIHEVMVQAISYLQSRVSGKVKFSIHSEDQSQTVHLNVPLFGWVVENLVKNAVDAMDGEGELNVSIRKEGRRVCIDISDTGKGIPKGYWKTVFEPGYTTKKRGWGLGLSLVKRIIEQYHEGRVYIKASEPNQGTTFRIELRE
ncbi:MAG TPA: HAMP domain-containing sensor histidine kinase [Flavobacteriales bacterium]